MKKTNFVLVGIIAMLSLTLVSAQTYNCPMGGVYSGMMGGYGLGFGIFSWLISLLVVIALALLIYWLIKKIGEKDKRNK